MLWLLFVAVVVVVVAVAAVVAVVVIIAVVVPVAVSPLMCDKLLWSVQSSVTVPSTALCT